MTKQINASSKEREPRMVLEGDGAARFSLDLIGYEFPEMTDDPYGFDVNWLMIVVEATDGTTMERFRGPYLLTSEVAELASWLEAGARGETNAPLSFTEPALRFEWPDGESSVLAARVRGDRHDSADLEVRLSASATDLREAASRLREGLARFPHRPSTAST